MDRERLAAELAKDEYGADYVLRQLAEECAELAQAALKVIRACNGETPMSYPDVMDNYIEELADVRIMVAVVMAGMFDGERNAVLRKCNQKLERMINRLSIVREEEGANE